MGLLLAILLLSGLQEGGNYPPDQVILLQNHNQVNLRWTLKAPTYQLEAWQDSKQIVSLQTNVPKASIQASPGRPVRWRVTARGRSFESHFTVAKSAEYHADGQPGTQTSYKSRGRAGGGADSLRVRLSRDGDGMHMILWHRRVRNHYLFVTPKLRFVLTARGGDGVPGIDGVDSAGPGRPNTPGTDGTDGGNGGRIVVSTAAAPWRDYLDIDVRAGSGGRGGRGGECHQDLGEGFGNYDYPDSRSGRDGIPGKVETVIQDGW